ncbi:MAG TPA: metallophosphoesterase [Azospirillaceae bacterium]|nr:metallophosphoesterase [Azospirillaceae bacterium]
MARTLAHISDLHFGRIRDEVVEALLADLAAAAPSLIIISGDFTQRARKGQYEAARRFLDRLCTPWLAVPGNHDVPTFDVVSRYLRPLTYFKRYITKDDYPLYIDEEIAVIGINTARAWVWDWSHGRVSDQQMRRVSEVMRGVSPKLFKVVFGHHPFLPPPSAPGTRLVGRARSALKALEAAGVELLLAGHLHQAYTGDVMSHHTHIARSILVAQASTATSTRVRGEPNAYNLITIDMPRVTFEVRSWEGAAFMPALRTCWRREGDRWLREELDPGLERLDRMIGRH